MVPFENFTLTIEAARHDDFVHTYVAKVWKKTAAGSWLPAGEFQFFSDFYRGLDRVADPLCVTVPGENFDGNCDYRLEIVPEESFGRRGAESVWVEFHTPDKQEKL
ncbi:hypothetical protein [Victivallis sp. Marseille-Q1083]|uniref:hypothetical protein n=1 Tax=Victivallis sp. Marseille-Q1083 TaxID=2717288 RepID=UPI00158CD316|nr:hypothetical protein [Victivallis sp. Marseille-Q1083]